ncbi:MAG TPA: non-heme iron oxygenase ferredoxin subunit [Flavobacteriales bacterium]|nr:non-heme iron oxygenase ferredoxin subunit [Flavobacteriales bacterium]
MTEENTYQLLCDSSEVEESSEATFEIKGRSILVIRSDQGELFAVENKCPHANEQLSGGRFRGGYYACPHHGARYELSTGKSMTNLSTKPLICFDVRENGGKIEIIVPKKEKKKFVPGGAPPGFGPM